MKRALALALVLSACSQKGSLPVIESFTVDNPNPEAGIPVQFSYSVTGATGIGIYPIPGPVDHSPVTLVPPSSMTFTLQATNDRGMSSRDIVVSLRPLA